MNYEIDYEKNGFNYDIQQRLRVESVILGTLLSQGDGISNGNMDAIREVVYKHDLQPRDFYNDYHAGIYIAIQEALKRGQETNPIIVNNYRPERFRTKESRLFYSTMIDCINNAMLNSKTLDYMILILKQYGLMDYWNDTAKNVLFSNWETRDVIQVGDNIIEEYNRLMGRYIDKLKESDNKNVEYVEELQKRVHNKRQGIASGVPTGIWSFDEWSNGWFPGELNIIAGRPGMGKTTYALISSYRASQMGTPVAFYSLEMPKNQLKSKIIAMETRIDYKKIKSGDLTNEELQRIIDFSKYLDNSNFHIIDNLKFIEDIEEKTDELKRKYNIGLAVIDYIQRAKVKKSNKIREEVVQISRACKGIAKDNYIPVIALSQVSRACEYRQNKRPTLADLKESGSIEEDADIVGFLYRQAYYDALEHKYVNPTELFHTELRIAKGRDLGNRLFHIWVDAINMFATDYRHDGNYDF